MELLTATSAASTLEEEPDKLFELVLMAVRAPSTIEEELLRLRLEV
jgi:hypothetical protein